MDGFGMFGVGVSAFMVVFFILFVGMLALFVFAIVSAARKNAQKNAQNSAAPEVSAAAAVIGKRVELSGGGDFPVRQSYFVTFEQPGGERFELEVQASDYGMLTGGDRGTVTMKGTRCLGFTREILR
jgi:hypothetical protein